MPKNPFLLKLFATLRFYTLGWLLLDVLTPSYCFFLPQGRPEMTIGIGLCCQSNFMIVAKKGCRSDAKKSIQKHDPTHKVPKDKNFCSPQPPLYEENKYDVINSNLFL
jgi:hypothetical protein